MTLQVTGKNIETSEAFRDYVLQKVNGVLEKYIGPDLGGHIRLEKERGRFRTTCSIRLRTGLTLEANGEGGDAYASADAALEHMEKRVRRYKRRLKNHHHGNSNAGPVRESAAPDYVVNLSDEADDGQWVEPEADAAPLIVAETERTIRELPVRDAVFQLDLTDEPFLVFRNAGHGGLNVVYRRLDGHIGWVDPAPLADSANSKADAKHRR